MDYNYQHQPSIRHFLSDAWGCQPIGSVSNVIGCAESGPENTQGVVLKDSTMGNILY